MYREGISVSLSDSFPVTLQQVNGLFYENVTYDSKDSLINDFFSYIRIKENTKKKMNQNLEEFGIKEPGLLIDYRTMQLLSLFRFYKNNPIVCMNNEVWFFAVNELNDLTKVF